MKTKSHTAPKFFGLLALLGIGVASAVVISKNPEAKKAFKKAQAEIGNNLKNAESEFAKFKEEANIEINKFKAELERLSQTPEGKITMEKLVQIKQRLQKDLQEISKI